MVFGCGSDESKPSINSAPRNFYLVSNGIYRSGALSKEDVTYLKDQVGIKSIVSLEHGSDSEKRAAIALGIKWDNIEMNTTPRVALDTAKVQLALNALKSYSKPTLIHCTRGSDRTGIVIAAYRLTVDKWSVEDAYHEMDTRGFNNIFYSNYKQELRTYLRL